MQYDKTFKDELCVFPMKSELRTQLLNSGFLTTLFPAGGMIVKNTIPVSMSAVVTRGSLLMKRNRESVNLKRRTVN